MPGRTVSAVVDSGTFEMRMTEEDVTFVYINYDYFEEQEIKIPLEAWLTMEKARQDKMQQADLAMSRELDTSEYLERLPALHQSFEYYPYRLKQ